MAAFNLFNDFAEQLAKGVHNFGTDTFKIFLCAAANTPLATNTVLANLTQVDYTHLGAANPGVTITVSDATDTILAADAVVITATNDLAPAFQFYGIYNESATSPTDALVCWWDHGTPVDLANGETFTINFNNDATAGTIMTIGQGSIT